MSRCGRRPKLTPEVLKKLCDAIVAGNNRLVAAQYAGVGRSTFLGWLAKGRGQRSGAYRDLLDAVKNAESKAEVECVAIIRKAARSRWQAAAWWLERHYPERWALERHLVRELARQAAQQQREIEDLRRRLADVHGPKAEAQV